MTNKPTNLYHGSTRKLDGPLEPILVQGNEDYQHAKPAVFATARKNLAALFMCPKEALVSIGFEQDIAYICIWGTSEEFQKIDAPGYLYVLPPDTFQKIGKEYEWQSFESVTPKEILEFPSALTGMMECGVRVYFINDDSVFNQIVKQKDQRMPLLKNLISENAKKNS